jgi:hypothetical protein
MVQPRTPWVVKEVLRGPLAQFTTEQKHGVLQVASSALYWPADELGSQTPGRLQPGDLSLHYTSCHIPSIYFGRNPLRSCLVRQVLSF